MENRTTELLKEMEGLNLKLKTEKRYYSHQNLIVNREKLKSQLRGRLDALKEELSFWEKSGFTEILLGFPLIKERIASIREEIKLIEGAI